MEKWTITGGLYVGYSTSLILACYASDKTWNQNMSQNKLTRMHFHCKQSF